MKKSTAIAVLTALICTPAIAQNDANYQWAKNIGGTFNDEGYNIAIDGSGNVYVTGMFQNTADPSLRSGQALTPEPGGK